ncbi:hypothetical protein J2Z83_000556 [Virgibacillus natechei]|uniref:Uncharacterized protein n=1 Tax=Virgibacillus natechei TaxID=1216297 RepID=A0ABS4IC03_9BACI|nr:hypothetical protein [Virgibacillus natechei]
MTTSLPLQDTPSLKPVTPRVLSIRDWLIC